jgi:hypothetical protein
MNPDADLIAIEAALTQLRPHIEAGHINHDDHRDIEAESRHAARQQHSHHRHRH